MIIDVKTVYSSGGTVVEERRRDLGHNEQGGWELPWKSRGPWHFLLARLYDGENCGEYLGISSPSILVYIAGFGHIYE